MENAKLTPKKVSMADCDRLSSAIVNAVLIETEDGSGDYVYMPQIRDMVNLYLQLNSFFPELNIKDVPIEQFFEGYADGKYDEYADILAKDRRAIYVSESVKSAIDAQLREFNGGRIQTAVLRFVNAINYILETQAVKFNDLGAVDIRKFISDFANFSAKNNPETLTRVAVENAKKSAKTDKV